MIPNLLRRAAAMLAGLAICATAWPAPPGADAGLPYTPGLDTSAMDTAVDPCTDFYRYACGGWQRRNPIPPDQTSWGVYQKLAEDNARFLRGILERAAAADGDPKTRQIGDYYAACMDESTVQRRGTAPIAPELAAIEALSSSRELAPLLARLQRETPDPGILFGAGAQQDPDDAEREIASLDQGGLGLPDRDYYFQVDPKSRQDRARYSQHIARLLELLGAEPAAARRQAEDVLELETVLAAASLTRVQRRDPYALKHKLQAQELPALAPGLDWPAYLAALGAARVDTVNVAAPDFFAELSRRLQTEPLATWKAYLRFHVANAFAPYLSRPFVAEDFAFHRQYLEGARRIQPRWKRCEALVDQQLGEALGRAFVDRVFAPATKEATVAMVRRIESVMERRLQTRDWMSPQTRAAALAKLHAIRNKVGYPDRWRDYSALHVERGDFAGNVQRAAAFELARQLGKIGRPVDHDEWGMTPPTVNAYYDAAMNDINFPAGILQPPLYDPRMDDAPNFGNTGGTIGHELTHGFDDEGRQYDGQGNLKDWWTPQDAERFSERVRCVSEQYGGYIAVDDIHVNSALTLGEDVADLGGEILAYEAWKETLAGSVPAPRDGLTAEQRFFVGFAQWACENTRPQRQRELALTDPHSPARFRINGVVVNMPEFARAFSCRARAPMTKPPGAACSIW
jgi:endothelin-converting enzyme/putative endopeptidase